MAVMFRRKQPREGGHDGAKPYDGLRAMALGAVAKGLQLPGEDHPDVSGLVVDIPAQGGFATVVALTDDTTSMYMSTGGGTIGAGGHQNVASATQALLSAAQAQLGAFTRPGDSDLPPPSQVRFHLLSTSGSRYEDVPEDSFWGRSSHEVMHVIAATQDVISAIRSSTPQGSPNSPG
jgi:ribosomal protein S12 methylthiotransferase accessory factor YcaO